MTPEENVALIEHGVQIKSMMKRLDEVFTLVSQQHDLVNTLNTMKCPAPGKCLELERRVTELERNHGINYDQITSIKLWKAEFRGSIIGFTAAFSFLFSVIIGLVSWLIQHILAKHSP